MRRGRMQTALDRFIKGQVTRDTEWRVADLSIRKIAALQALVRWGRKISNDDLASIAIEPNLWPTSGGDSTGSICSSARRISPAAMSA